MYRARSVAVAAALAALVPLIAPSAEATPIRYDFVTGTASVRVVQNLTVLSSDTATMTGTFATFDAALPALTDFEFVVDDSAVNVGPFGSVDAFLTATPSTGFSAPATPIGVDTWDWAGGPYDVVGSLSFTGGPLNGQTIPVNLTLPDLQGNFRTANAAGDTFSLTNGIDVYQFDFNGQHYILQLGVGFKGVAVPEPSTAALVAVGLAAVAGRRRA